MNNLVLLSNRGDCTPTKPARILGIICLTKPFFLGGSTTYPVSPMYSRRISEQESFRNITRTLKLLVFGPHKTQRQYYDLLGYHPLYVCDKF